jgi:mitochondrial fission protein ELM1
VTEGIAGTENQCIGVAEALGLDPIVKRVKLRSPWKELTPWLTWGQEHAYAEDSSPISAPWPDLVIASGRKAVATALYIKKKHKKTFTVMLQDPKVDPKLFDLVAVPQHDSPRGKNVVVTAGACNRITKQKLDFAAKEWGEKLKDIPKPRVAVLIGGTSKAHTMTPENASLLAKQLLAIADRSGLMITASRRTGEENTALLRDLLEDKAFFWDGKGDNPYFAFLALADYIIVTEDSVSMASEALATGKPVYIAALEGGARRLDLFQKNLQDQGYTRPFLGALESWTYTPPDDTRKVAEEIKKRMKLS